MKKILATAMLLLAAWSVRAQQYPVFSQYYLTPYLYNPAAVANSGQTEVNLLYRQQWSGIKDAPTTQAFTFEYPTKKRLYFGANFYRDKTVLLNTSSLMLGLAYRVDLAKNQSIKFGISSGVGFNNFDLANADYPDDDALKNVLNKTTFLSGQFGVFYQAGNFKLGASLPQLYKFSAVDTAKFQAFQLDPVKNYVFTASYSFKFKNGVLGLEPFAMYRKDELLPNIIEAGAMLNVKDVVIVGGSYRKDYGASGYFGINLKKNLSFGYAYEFAPSQVTGIGNGTHEFSLKFRFGPRKTRRKSEMVASASAPSMYMGSEQTEKSVLKSKDEPSGQKTDQKSRDDDWHAVASTNPAMGDKTLVAESVNTELKSPEEKGSTASEGTKAAKPVLEAPPTGRSNDLSVSTNEGSSNALNDNEDLTAKKKKETTEDVVYHTQNPSLAVGLYVVLGAFAIEQNAVLFSRGLNGRGITAKYQLIPERNLFYVYTFHTLDEKKAQKLRREFSKMKEYSDVWVFEVK